MEKITVIRIRRGLGKARYCACDDHGNPIQGFNKLSDIRRQWKKEIQWGSVMLVRELDRVPDLETLSETIKCIDKILRGCAKKENLPPPR